MRAVDPAAADLWDAYIACRVRTLYDPYGLPASCANHELDHPRARPDVLHRAIVSPDAATPGGVVAVGRLDLQPAEVPPGVAVPAAQLRYFGVDADQRGKGVGRLLLLEFEREARERGVAAVWFDARAEAVAFYARCGYRDIGPGPTKWDRIPHRKMARDLA